MLIAFQAYLDSNPPYNVEVGSLNSFKKWMSEHPEFTTMLDEFDAADLGAIVPVERMTPGDGLALTSEVLEVVNKRNGAVLAKQTILKHDLFPNCQKLSLPDRIEGAPNYRCIPFSSIRSNLFKMISTVSPSNAPTVFTQATGSAVTLPPSATAEFPALSSGQSVRSHSITSETGGMGSSVYGTAMPTMDGIRTVLKKVHAGPNSHRKLYWTSLREEPVIYVNGRPFVLRLFQDPLKNLEATGIARERVEQMEIRMKMDIIAELRIYNGRLLLHEEEVDGSVFSIVPVWESVKEEDVRTPSEVFEAIKHEGYHVDYLRIPITDEQAPIPNVFDELVGRLIQLDEYSDSLFNCQMGRGRTTTGMVVASLMEMIVGNSFIFDEISEDYHTVTGLEKLDDDPQQRYQNGEYKLILQLIAVLQYGKLAKRLTDSAIDTCEHLQNLRVAIFDFKLRVEALSVGSKKYEALHEVALNYLIRYFYLITFADYLLEEMTGSEWLSRYYVGGEDERSEMVDRRYSSRSPSPYRDDGDIVVPGADTMSIESKSVGRAEPSMVVREPRLKFSEWLQERREIKNLVRVENQSLD